MRTDRFRLIVRWSEPGRDVALLDHLDDPHESPNIAARFSETVNRLLPLPRKGNTGIIPRFEK